MFRSHWRTSILGLVAAACASTPGARPHDMSAAQHEGDGQSHAATANRHAAQYQPNLTRERTRCSPRGASRSSTDIGTECWTFVSNPTAEHLRTAREHQGHADDHRAASAALRGVEVRACFGLSIDDQDTSPFDHVEDIASVRALTKKVGTNKAPFQRTVGAVVTLRAIPGMTTEWLQRVVDCHLARNAALGHPVDEMPNCPLAPNGARAHVVSTRSGFAVSIRSDDPPTAREILSRAKRLQSAH